MSLIGHLVDELPGRADELVRLVDCVRISFICVSVRMPAFLKALSIGLISSRWDRRSRRSVLPSPVGGLSIFWDVNRAFWRRGTRHHRSGMSRASLRGRDQSSGRRSGSAGSDRPNRHRGPFCMRKNLCRSVLTSVRLVVAQRWSHRRTHPRAAPNRKWRNNPAPLQDVAAHVMEAERVRRK